MTLSLFRPGSTWLHRLPAGPKIASLLVAGIGLTTIGNPALLAGAAAVALALLVATGAPAADIRRQIVAVAVIGVLVIAANGLLTDIREGVRFALRLAALVWLAASVTFTTRTDAIMDLLDRGLGRFGDQGRRLSERIGLSVALVIRFVPELFAHAGALGEACRARGIRPTALMLVVPLLIRTLKTADAVTDALEARGYPRDG